MRNKLIATILTIALAFCFNPTLYALATQVDTQGSETQKADVADIQADVQTNAQEPVEEMSGEPVDEPVKDNGEEIKVSELTEAPEFTEEETEGIVSAEPVTGASIQELTPEEDLPPLTAQASTNTSKEKAATLKSGTAVSDSLTKSLDERWYKITLNSSGYIDAKFTRNATKSTSVLWRYYIYNDKNEVIYSSDIPGRTTSTITSFPRIGLKAGNYYIKVTTGEPVPVNMSINAYWWTTASFKVEYTFTKASNWEAELNGSTATANTLALNTDIKGTLMRSTDSDYYKITLSKRGYLTTSLQHAKISDNNEDYWMVHLYDKDKKLISTMSFKGNTASRETSFKNGLPAGTYYLEVQRGSLISNTYYSSTPYTLRANYLDDSTYEMEMNNTKDTANTLTANKWINGTISHNKDEDWYLFTCPSDGTLSYDFRHPNVGKDSNVWESKMWNANHSAGNLWNIETAKCSYPYKGNAAKEERSSTFNVRKGETYLIRIQYCYSLSREVYGLRVNFTAKSGTNTSNSKPTTSNTNSGGSKPNTTTKPSTSSSSSGVKMHRMYNPNSGEHFYTANTAERDMLKGVGWKYEGIGWTAPSSGADVYRLYNPNAGDHHYTPNAAEKNMLVKAGWRYEGVGWKSGGSTPLYRQYNPNAVTGTHNYTTNKGENDMLVRIGWRGEGVGWYGL